MNLTAAPGTPEVGTARNIERSSPHHQGSVESAFDLSNRLELDLDYRYVSALGAMSIPSYSTGDARFSWKFSRELALSVVGRNLLQPHHFEFQGDPGPLVGIRRSGYLSMTWMR